MKRLKKIQINKLEFIQILSYKFLPVTYTYEAYSIILTFLTFKNIIIYVFTGAKCLNKNKTSFLTYLKYLLMLQTVLSLYTNVKENKAILILISISFQLI